MYLERRQRNSLGRDVPIRIADRVCRALRGSFAEGIDEGTHPARTPRRPCDDSPTIANIAGAIAVLRDGDALSFPHCSRNGGDRFLRAVIGEIRCRDVALLR